MPEDRRARIPISDVSTPLPIGLRRRSGEFMNGGACGLVVRSGELSDVSCEIDDACHCDSSEEEPCDLTGPRSPDSRWDV